MIFQYVLPNFLSCYRALDPSQSALSRRLLNKLSISHDAEDSKNLGMRIDCKDVLHIVHYLYHAA